MISAIYELIGRLVVWFVRVRYGRQIRLALAATVGAAVLGGYLLARRQPPEG
jgi:hypothetical protein